MAEYHFVFMMDFGSGTCLWSKNKAAEDKYGYAVDIEELPVSKKLKKEVLDLISRHDGALNWNEPNGSLIWTK